MATAIGDENSIIQVRGLNNTFGTQVVHDKLDLDVYRGEILGVVGGSGTGKSVLMRSILGLNPLARGDIWVNGRKRNENVADPNIDTNRDWGVLFQDGALFTSLTVGQNIQVPLVEHYNLRKEVREDIARLKVKLSGLPPEAYDKFPSELSGGMRKRAALARALALDPDIVFLDEPTAGLDPISAAAFDELIHQLSRSLGLTVFMITHDLDSLFSACDRIAVLAEKRIIVNAPLDEVMAYDHPWIQEYFKGKRSRALMDSRA